MDMVRKTAIAALVMMLVGAGRLAAQEVLLPLQAGVDSPHSKSLTDGAATLPFFDDFSQPTDKLQPVLWEACGASVGTGFGELAPTVGLATLDALDATGNLYPQATTTPFPADTLMSRRIRLDSVSPADSLVLSFFYLPGGGSGNLWERIGDTPDPTDSIYLDLYNNRDSNWTTVWARGGVSVDTLIAQTGKAWQYVAVGITDSAYFDSSFRFRFRNHCSLDATSKKGMKGNCDQWNIDYLILDTGRSVTASPVWRDVAFADAAPKMLEHYRAMPARQYRSTEMAQSMTMTIANLFNSDLATQYAYCIVDEEGDTVHRYDGGFENAPAGGYQNADAHAHPTIGYSFPESTNSRSYEVIHTVREGVGGDSRSQNDTVRFHQVLSDYYAYDDGSPENGYGLTSTASHVYLAYRFDLNTEDTLSAIDLYFNRTLDAENEAIMFYITVWQAGDNGRPGTILYRDSERRRPKFGGMNEYQRYALEQPTVVDGSIFVGFEQVGNDFINLGFDRNNQSADRIWYLTSTEWQQSILRGSLMLRPCFGSEAVNGIETPYKETAGIIIFPNPSDDHCTVGDHCVGIELFDQMGRRVATSRSNRIDTGDLPSGLYAARITTHDGTTHVTKLIIRH